MQKRGLLMKKRLLAALMAGAMALSMAACGNSNTDSTTQDTGSGDDAAAQAGDYNVGIVQLVQHEALDASHPGLSG